MACNPPLLKKSKETRNAVSYSSRPISLREGMGLQLLTLHRASASSFEVGRLKCRVGLGAENFSPSFSKEVYTPGCPYGTGPPSTVESTFWWTQCWERVQRIVLRGQIGSGHARLYRGGSVVLVWLSEFYLVQFLHSVE